jgi:hypothetical protein
MRERRLIKAVVTRKQGGDPICYIVSNGTFVHLNKHFLAGASIIEVEHWVKGSNELLVPCPLSLRISEVFSISGEPYIE